MPKTLKYVPTLIHLLPKPQAWSTKVGQPFSDDILFCLLKCDIADAWLFGLLGFFPQKKLLCRHSKVLFNMSLFSNNLWFWETAHVWTDLTSDFNRRVSKTDTASGSKKGSRHKVPSTCILSNGRQGVTFLVGLKSTQPQNRAWLLLSLTSVHFPDDFMS